MKKQEGFDDPYGKGMIFWKLLDYIKTKRPKTFILENVKGLVTLNNGKHMRKILKELRK